MKSVQIQALQKAIQLLDVIGAEYKIVTPDGKKHGKLKVVAKKKQRTAHFERGMFAAIYKDRLDAAKIGDVVQIPFAELETDDPNAIKGLRSSASAYASTTWGAGSYTSTVKNGMLEFLRIL